MGNDETRACETLTTIIVCWENAQMTSWKNTRQLLSEESYIYQPIRDFVFYGAEQFYWFFNDLVTLVAGFLELLMKSALSDETTNTNFPQLQKHIK